MPVELGPEFIHGEKENMLLDYLQKHGVSGKPNATTMQLKWPNYLYFGKEGKLVSGPESEQDKELTRMLDTFEMTGELDADLIPEESLLQYMVRMGTPSRLIDMADAIFANDYGTEASNVGLRYRCPELQSPIRYITYNLLAPPQYPVLEYPCAIVHTPNAVTERSGYGS